MVNNSLIKSCFKNLVGFNNSFDPEYPMLSDSLRESRSGWFIDQVHPLCSIDNIYNAAPNFKNFVFDFREWNIGLFKKGDKVQYEGVNFRALADVIGDAPPVSDTEHWEVYNPFSEWLENFLDASAINFANEFLTEKKLMMSTKGFIDSLDLYQGNGSMSDRIIKNGRFVGVQITTNKQEGLVVKINSVGLQIDTPQEDLKLYLYHSSQVQPLKIIDTKITNAGSFSWIAMDDLTLDGSEVNSDGVFFLGYYEDDLFGQALRREMDLMRPCSSCSSFNINSFNTWSKYAKIKAFSVRESDLNQDRTVFEFDAPEFENSSNFGINLKISVYCDLSSLICKNINILAEAFAQKVALSLIEQIAFNTRLNVISDQTKQLAMSELTEKEDSSSFLMRYKRSLKAATLDLGGTSSICLPCTRKGPSIRRTAI